MKFNNKELLMIYSSLRSRAGILRAIGRDKDSKPYDKLADKMEKEISESK